MSALSFQKKTQRTVMPLSYEERVNEHKAISVRNTLDLLYFQQCTEFTFQKQNSKVESSYSEVFFLNVFRKNRQNSRRYL